MAIIYKITNPKKEVYIGSSSRNDICVRKNEHKYSWKSGVQSKLYDSFDYYGFDTHKFEIVCDVEESERYDLEHFIISEFEPKLNIVKEYNNTAKGKMWVNDGINEFQIYPNTFDTFNNINKGRLFNTEAISNRQKGRKHSKELIDRRTSHSRKAVDQYENGVLINTFESLSAACRELNLDKSSISKSCRGIIKNCGGFEFSFKK